VPPDRGVASEGETLALITLRLPAWRGSLMVRAKRERDSSVLPGVWSRARALARSRLHGNMGDWGRWKFRKNTDRRRRLYTGLHTSTRTHACITTCLAAPCAGRKRRAWGVPHGHASHSAAHTHTRHARTPNARAWRVARGGADGAGPCAHTHHHKAKKFNSRRHSTARRMRGGAGAGGRRRGRRLHAARREERVEGVWCAARCRTGVERDTRHATRGTVGGVSAGNRLCVSAPLLSSLLLQL